MLAQSGRTCRPRGKLSVHTRLLYVISLVFTLSATACSTLHSGNASLDELSSSALWRASIHTPEGSGPHPVVIDLHGCGGVWQQRQSHWRRHLQEAGFAVLSVDSFSGRGADDVCAQPFSVSPYQRTFDVAAAINMVKDNELLNQHAMFLLGSSHGGTSALMTNLYSTPVFSQLRGVVAYYPYCPSQLPALNADLLLIIGSADEWTPAKLCEEMRILNQSGHSYELLVYPHAHHSFDIPGVNSVYFGYQVRYHPVAAKDSMRRTLDFMLRRLHS